MSSSLHLSRLTLLLALSSATVLLAACGKPPAGGPPPVLRTPQVSVITITPQRVALTTELPGRTAPVQIAEVRPQITGLVQSRNFTEGSDVKAGDLLYQVDPATYRASVNSAQAAQAKAEANLQTVRLKAERFKDLRSIHAVSQQEADDAEAALRQGEADVAAAKASLETARINLAYTRVTAPISGRIGRSTVTPGALVTANQASALSTVQQLDPIYVDVTQSATAVLRLRRALAQGQLSGGTANAAQVSLLLEDGSRYALPGKLKFSDVTVDQSTGAITLRAEFPNPTGELLPGMYVRALVEEGVKDQALLVPQRAVSRDAAGKPIAYVVNDEGKLEQRLLQTERAIGNQWLVTSGLKPGERLVVERTQQALPGAEVQVVPDTSPIAATTPAPASNSTSPTSLPAGEPLATAAATTN